MRHFERILIALLALTLLLPAMWALAENEDEVTATCELEYLYESEGWDSDAMLQGYVDSLLGAGGRRLFRARNLGGDLKGFNKIAYDYLSGCIADVAAGRASSTEFGVPLSETGLEGKRYTASDLGLSSLFSSDNKITSETQKALFSHIGFDLTPLVRSLIWDHPYEMYWFDKTISVKCAPSIGGSITNQYVYFKSDMVFRFAVAKTYVSGAYNAEGTYTFDTAKGQATVAATNRAKEIVAKYADASDYQKLLGFKETICDLTEYNNDAAGEKVEYGDPWQLIYVFDGDTSTKVVCEGYSKAFQYLCDMTSFDDDSITCICATGEIESGKHMWNIVHMSDGNNYLVDVTNCDGAGVGAPNRLFMAGTENGTVRTGYTFALSRDFKYTYYTDTFNLFSESELTLAKVSYTASKTLPIDQAHFPDAALCACVAEAFDADLNGTLTFDEISTATSFNVNGKGITSMAGIEYLTELTALNCANNNLTELDISKNTRLANVVDLRNRSLSGSSKLYQTGAASLTCDLGVRLITGRDSAYVAELPSDLKTIGSEAFKHIASERVVIPEGCAEIGAQAFTDCPNLCEVVIPASAAGHIADDAFIGSPDVFIISESGDVRTWASNHQINSAAQ